MTPEQIVIQFQNLLMERGFRGEFHTDQPTRLINATDNSIYEVLPLAVAQPFDGADLELLIRLANQEPFSHLYFCPRGGGTGTNGQSLSNGVVIDFSRFMTRILEFKPEEGTITVEPGVILSDLNRMLKPHGLSFAPHVSTADRATIGGMIATDAAGKGSLIYGKTADHLLGLKAILPSGAVIDTLNPTRALTPAHSALNKQLEKLLAPQAAEIAARFPPLLRPLSGYNLKQAYHQGQLSWEHLLAGSEGTLAVVASAKLKLVPLLPAKALIVVHYPSFMAALQDARFLIEFKPLAIEAVDEKVQQSAQSLPNWPELAKLLQAQDHAYISNFVEFAAANAEELHAQIAPIQAALAKRNANYVLITNPDQINQLWSIRSLAVGLVAKLPGARKPVAFVEDAIVPPQHLAEFVSELQAELDKRNLSYAMYGHVDVGCIHVRPALDLQQPSEREQIRPVTEMVIKLLDKYNGVLWGEHGKGYRGEYVPHVFGPQLYQVLCQIKALCDPHNRFNPGKLTAPNPELALTKIDKVTMRGSLDQAIVPSLQRQFPGAMLCNGNGACFNQEPTNVMCPSYKVTRDRIHSPKGRAMLVKEWLRAKSRHSDNEIAAANHALAALEGCLGCKGCAGKCPTQVSIPDLRTNFLHSYYQKYGQRSLREWLLGHIEGLIPYAAKYPQLWNFIHRFRLAPSFGLAHIPLFSSTLRLTQRLEAEQITIYPNPRQIHEMAFKPKPVVIFADVFTSFFDDKVLFATLQVLKHLGCSPYLIYPRQSGKSLIVGGFIDEFRKNTARLARLLDPLFAAKIPVIGLENTITLLFRDEVSKFAQPLQGKVQTLAEFLISQAEGLAPHTASTTYQLLPHCTEQAVLPAEASTWQQIFKQLGLSLAVKNLGCCGMAGSYGYLPQMQANSAGLFKMNWQASLTKPDAVLLATGFSCRGQVKRFNNQILFHPIEVIAALMSGTALS